ncbi:MAG: hypothetical protein QOH39_2770 [Verrucomicrobiota bacterium]|jgi:hypothetical protein
MNGSLGFFLTNLTVRGQGKADAMLDFADGFNVISGASDTGKSFALSCIDFAFGARDAPRQIPEVSGYDSVLLRIIARATSEQFVIRRGLAGGDIKLTRFDSAGNQLGESTISARHSATERETLSGFLLELSGLWGRQIRKNARGDRRSLSFRDVAFLCIVDEERIIAERAPQLSSTYFENTTENQVLRLLITGTDSGEVIVIPTKVEPAAIDAKLDLIQSMIESNVAELRRLGVSEDDVDAELGAIDAARATTLSEYEASRTSVADLEDDFRNHASELRQIQSRSSIVDGLIKRFELLKSHYDSNIARLTAIEETGSLLQALPSQRCPVCGAPPEAHALRHAGEQYQISSVHAAARVEAEKIKSLEADLDKLLAELATENGELRQRAASTSHLLKEVQSRIDNELMPRVKESAQALEQHNVRRDVLLRSKGITEQLAQLRASATDLGELRTTRRSPSPRVSTIPTTAEMDDFAGVVQTILTEWKYPSVGRVVFSEADQDLVIGGNPRASHGKGVRALTCAAFILAIQRHSLDKNLPHPSFVVLDSPLVAYQEPDPAGEVQRLLEAGVKEAFYSSLASNSIGRQVIVFENQDPPSDLEGTIRKVHFTKSDTGRYGFFPPLPKNG